MSGPLSGFHVCGRVPVSYRGFWAITPELQSVPAGPLLHPPLAAHYKMPASLHVRSAPGTLSTPVGTASSVRPSLCSALRLFLTSLLRTQFTFHTLQKPFTNSKID